MGETFGNLNVSLTRLTQEELLNNKDSVYSYFSSMENSNVFF